MKQNYIYRRLHPEIKNVHLESIEHHIKYKRSSDIYIRVIEIDEYSPNSDMAS